jgi:pantothenate kinase type III
LAVGSDENSTSTASSLPISTAAEFLFTLSGATISSVACATGTVENMISEYLSASLIVTLDITRGSHKRCNLKEIGSDRLVNPPLRLISSPRSHRVDFGTATFAPLRGVLPE